MKKINYVFLGSIFVQLFSWGDSSDALIQVSDKNNTEYNGCGSLTQLYDEKLIFS